MFCIYCGKELPESARFCAFCGKKLGSIPAERKQAAGGVSRQEKAEAEPMEGLTLTAFRQHAPEDEGHREALLSYRKSLPNSWDYNAYVGILLGVGGSKYGDAACMNYAIGQGDNGKNVQKTLAGKGLTSLFEKFKGKNAGGSVLLSDVEDEILAIAPEYRNIRETFHSIIGAGGAARAEEAPKESQEPKAPEKEKPSASNDEFDELFRNAIIFRNVASRQTEAEQGAQNTVEKYRSMKKHREYYTFPAWQPIKDNYGLNPRLSDGALVQERDGYLYYVGTHGVWKLYRLSLHDDKPAEVLASFPCDWHDQFVSNFRLGAEPLFCVSGDRIYLSSRGKVHSISTTGGTVREEGQYPTPVNSPWMVGGRCLLEMPDRGRGKTVIAGGGNMERVFTEAKVSYYAINDSRIIRKSDTDTAVYDIGTGKKCSIKKLYKGLGNHKVLFIDAQKDILYYLEDENVYGKIIGISMDGEIVDEWSAVTQAEFPDGVKWREKFSLSGYSCLSFDGSRRLYKFNCHEKRDGVEQYFWWLYQADRNGTCELLLSFEGFPASAVGSVLLIQTPGAVIFHINTINMFLGSGRLQKEYMLTTSEPRMLKPLFPEDTDEGEFRALREYMRKAGWPITVAGK